MEKVLNTIENVIEAERSIRGEVLSKLSDTKQPINFEEYEIMREWLKIRFSNDFIDDSVEQDILILYIKAVIADITEQEEFYYFGNDIETDLYLWAKALYKISC